MQRQQTSRKNIAAKGQLDLFASPQLLSNGTPTPQPMLSAAGVQFRPVLQPGGPGANLMNLGTAAELLPPPIRKEPSRRLQQEAAVRVVTVDDLPSYPTLDQELVQKSLKTLPAEKIWFTYSAVRECFGISRATVARRVKEGLVPGIKFRGASVLEDGPVRRFDREQLFWLLLSVRTRRSPPPSMDAVRP